MAELKDIVKKEYIENDDTCIIEFTATPAKESNVLHRVSAMELKAEEMIKLQNMQNIKK